MKKTYSKKSADIQFETTKWLQNDTNLLDMQRKTCSVLENAPGRTVCILCLNHIANSNVIKHRYTNYLRCNECGHIQSKGKPPANYPWSVSDSGFDSVYPALDPLSYQSRRDRIYLPKLLWLLQRLNDIGIDSHTALRRSWLELGCGAGYFLDALRINGASSISGLDENKNLVNNANRALGFIAAKCTDAMLDDLDNSSSEIYVAFFVLEHLENAAKFWDILSRKPKGTLFYFSVPMFSISTLFEAAFLNRAARNLDSVVHTQLYTESSLNYIFELSGYEIVSEWLFGQDANDIIGSTLSALNSYIDAGFPKSLYAQINSLIDPLQEVIDKSGLCDARHILLIKR